MKDNFIAVLLIILVIAMGLISLRFFSGMEDVWICENGSWVKHGNPSAPMPLSGCADLNERPKNVNSFEECLRTGILIETYPRQCRTEEGKYFEEDTGDLTPTGNPIIVDSPMPGQAVESPLEVEGKARGNWFFKGTFTVKLYDAEGKLLAFDKAYAGGDWKTYDYVGFFSNLEFQKPTAQKGRLILAKDNPAGLSEKSESIEIEVNF